VDRRGRDRRREVSSHVIARRGTGIHRAVAVVMLGLLAGCGFGNPWPTAPAPRSGTLDVVLFGDSLMYTTGPFLKSALEFDGQPSTVVDRSIIASGLLNSLLPAYIESNLPAQGVVVFEYLGICLYCPYEYGSPEFLAAWEDAMRAAIAVVRAHNLGVVWVKPPPVANAYFVDVSAELGEMVDRVTADLGVVEADWTRALADTAGAFQVDLWYANVLENPWVHRVRAGDGVHLTDEGRRRASAWTAAAVIAAAP
jgi:hypothetical protein